MAKKVTLITGISGQDGSYLAELLLEKGYEVHGIIRRSSSFNTSRISHIFDKIILHYGDLTDPIGLISVIKDIKPDYVFNLAAMSHVQVSFKVPYYSSMVDAIGTLNLLEAVRMCDKDIRVYQASTSELFGKVQEIPQKETTPFYPRSPYGASKLYSYWVCKNYRESFNMFICNGILFNHSSPRRTGNFILKKITDYVKNLKKAEDSGTKIEKLKLGNLDAKRDFGYAKEYVEAMYKIITYNTPEEFVIATGETHSIKEACEEAFGYFGFNYKDHVEIDSKYFRPTEVDILIGDARKARDVLGWTPKVRFKDLIKIMMEKDFE